MLQKFFPEGKRRELLLQGIVLLGLIGMGCILLSSFGSSKPAKEAQPEASQSETQESYRLAMQEQLTEMLEAISGVGRVQVLVTLGGSEEYQYARTDERTVSDNQMRSSTSYVTVGGSSKEPLLESVSHPEITGVVVACDGGASSSVQEAVYKAVGVACGLSTAQIFVTKLAN